jgi:alpha-glucosidase
MLADTPSHYVREPEIMEFLAPVPTVWDETRVLNAKIGDYVAVARRKGREWYIGAMTDWTARTLDVEFSFLPVGNFQMDAYEDGPNADRVGIDYRKTKTAVKRSSKLKIRMAPGGGWAARIYVER